MMNEPNDAGDWDEYGESEYFSSAWLLEGLTGSRCGTLSLKNGRLVFAADGRRVFDAPLAHISDVVFPWYYFSGGVRLRIGAEKYRLSFVRPNGEPGFPDIRAGRETGKMWKSLLT